MVIDGSGARFPAGKTGYRGFAVRVTNEVGRPLADAQVTFRLPEEGPTGSFPGGGRAETVRSDKDGQAVVWGIQWNKTPGSCQVRVLAAKGAVRAGTLFPVEITSEVVSKPGENTASPPPHEDGTAPAEPSPAAAEGKRFALRPQAVDPITAPESDGAAVPATTPVTSVAISAEGRPGVILTRGTGGEPLPSGRHWSKWATVGLIAAGAVGGTLAWRLSQNGASTTAGAASTPVTGGGLIIRPVTSIGLPVITIGRPNP